MPAEKLDRIHSPAGIAIGAKSPEEIAVSILAQIVEQRRAGAEEKPSAAAEPAAEPPVSQALDPICGMTVEVATARHTAEHAGRVYYFCCGGCRQRFVAEPERYAEAGAA